jgi:hypothetical protein
MIEGSFFSSPLKIPSTVRILHRKPSANGYPVLSSASCSRNSRTMARYHSYKVSSNGTERTPPPCEPRWQRASKRVEPSGGDAVGGEWLVGIVLDKPNAFTFALRSKNLAFNRRPELVLRLGPSEQIERRSGKSSIRAGGSVTWHPDVDRHLGFLWRCEHIVFTSKARLARKK